MEIEDKVIDLCGRVIPYFERTFFNRYIEDYKDYLGYKGDRAKDIDTDWQTNIVFPLVSSIVDTQYASMYDSNFHFEASGEGIDGTDKLLNHAFDYEGSGKESLMEAIKECLIVGVGYLKPTYEKRTEVIPIKKQQIKVKHKRVGIEYVSVFNVFYDYSNTIERSPFLIERHILTRESIIKKYSRLFETDEGGVSAIDATIKVDGTPYSTYDIGRVKHIISYEEMIGAGNFLTNIPIKQGHVFLDETISATNNIFAVDFKSNAVYEVIEYTDSINKVILINGAPLFTAKRILRQGDPMVSAIRFSKIPGSSDSLGVASMLRDLQKPATGIMNIYLDNLKMSIAPMFQSIGGTNSFMGNDSKFKYKPYKVVPVNVPDGLRKVDLGIDGYEPINIIQFLVTVARERVGVSEYVLGVQGKVERVPGSVDMLFNQYKSRLLPMTDSVGTCMGRIAKTLLIMYANFFEEPELRELGLEDKLNVETFINEKNVKFQINSLSLLEKQDNLNNLLENLVIFRDFAQNPDGSQNIDFSAVLKAVLTKDISVKDILKKTEAPQPQQPQGQPMPQGQPQESPQELQQMLAQAMQRK